MSLREYKRKRDFSITAEPAGKEARHPVGTQFVVQKHDATRLHYDFRLEMEGVLKSWAVPKGFPTKRGERRLAVQVEDHPFDYKDFEGTIPEGQYGGGTVMVWDFGTYEAADADPLKALADGKLRCTLHGEKLDGEWTIVRGHDGDDRNWFLIKTGADVKPISKQKEEHSALTGRTLAQIAAAKDAIWQSNREPVKAPKERRSPGRRPTNRAEGAQSSGKAARSKPTAPEKTGTTSASSRQRSGDRRSVGASKKPAALKLGPTKPKWVEPMKATLVNEPPTGLGWLYELKWDGFRAIAVKDGADVQLISRNNKPLTGDFPELAAALAELPAQTAVLDGEICALDPQGRPAFQLLQSREMGGSRPPLYFYAFDLLQRDGDDLMARTLVERKAELQALLENAPEAIRFSGAIEGKVDTLLEEVRKRGMEGLIGKLRDAPYQPGVRTKSWVKLKVTNEQEFVIGGATPPQGARKHFGALLVGYYESKKLRLAGKVGTGFNEAWLKRLWKLIRERETPDCPFTDLPKRGTGRWNQGISAAEMRRCTWCRPELVCQVKFTEWTHDGSLRHPVFLGLREDKSAAEVTRER